MTPPQEPTGAGEREYRIKESELEAYDMWYPTDQKPSGLCENIRSRPLPPADAPAQHPQTGLYGISSEEIGELLDITEDITMEEDREKQVILCRKRIDLINTIKERGTVPPTTPLISFGKYALESHDLTIATAAKAEERKRILKESCKQCPMQDETPDTCENCLIHKVCSSHTTPGKQESESDHDVIANKVYPRPKKQEQR